MFFICCWHLALDLQIEVCMIFLSWLTTWCTVHNILLKITLNILLCIVKIPHFHSFLVNIFKEEQRQSLKTLGITKNLMQWWATLVYEMSLLYLSSQGCRNWRQISCYLSVQSRWCSSCLGIVNHHSVRIYCTWGVITTYIVVFRSHDTSELRKWRHCLEHS